MAQEKEPREANRRKFGVMLPPALIKEVRVSAAEHEVLISDEVERLLRIGLDAK